MRFSFKEYKESSISSLIWRTTYGEYRVTHNDKSYPLYVGEKDSPKMKEIKDAINRIDRKEIEKLLDYIQDNKGQYIAIKEKYSQKNIWTVFDNVLFIGDNELYFIINSGKYKSECENISLTRLFVNYEIQYIDKMLVNVYDENLSLLKINKKEDDTFIEKIKNNDNIKRYEEMDNFNIYKPNNDFDLSKVTSQYMDFTEEELEGMYITKAWCCKKILHYVKDKKEEYKNSKIDLSEVNIESIRKIYYSGEQIGSEDSMVNFRIMINDLKLSIKALSSQFYINIQNNKIVIGDSIINISRKTKLYILYDQSLDLCFILEDNDMISNNINLLIYTFA